MTKTKSLLFLILFFGILKSQNSIDIVLDTYKKDKDLQHATYSFCILDAASGKLLKEYNSELALVPASTLKVVTTSAALGILGKDFTYKTKFYNSTFTDSIKQKTLSVLYIKGSGDPSFNSTYFNNNDSSFVNSIVQKLKAGGVKKLTGNVIVDNTYFDNKIPDTWIWSDIGNYFGAGPNGLSYKDNKFSVYLNSGALNSTAELVDVKPTFYKNLLKINTNVKSAGTEDDAFVYGDPYSYSPRKISGTIPPNKKNYEVEAQAPLTHLFFASELSQALQKNNLQDPWNHFNDTDNNEYTVSNDKLIYTYVSPSLEKIVYYTNLKSNNHYAESLLNTVGAVKSGKQGTTANGITAVVNYWKDRGIDVTGLHMVDGSGLSRANTITTKTQATILSKIYRDSLMYPAFNASLPIAGKNGSMISLCKGTYAEGNMRAKTGYINRARGYCGYVKTKSGKELAFSVLFNNYDCSPKEMKLKIEKLLVALVDL